MASAEARCRAFLASALLRQLAYLAGYGTLGIVLTLATVFGVHLARLPPLMPWHLAPLTNEFRAADAPKFASLDDYRAAEARLMAELDAEVYAQVPSGEGIARVFVSTALLVACAQQFRCEERCSRTRGLVKARTPRSYTRSRGQ